MSLIEIKSRWSSEVIFKLECESFGLCVIAAVKSGAKLSGAILSGANLYGANLYGADLSDADLSDANLSDANLSGAILSGAKYGEGIPLENIPIQITGTKWFIIIMDAHIKIGCQIHTSEKWDLFTDEEISAMAIDALPWWNEWKGILLSISLGHQQRIANKNIKK
jgi:uncharacterized protein YjbI with pentapeptide repeats